MSSDLSYLASLITMIDKEGNDDSRKKLWSLISVKAMDELKSFTDKDAAHFINAVHELNLEQHIRVQAKNFYDDFALEEIKPQLINDFVEMEHCKRRDDFEGFSMAAFQQVENIVNCLFNKTGIWEKAKAKRDVAMFSYKNKDGLMVRFGFLLKNQLVFVKDESSRNKITDEFFRKSIAELDFVSKFRMVLYFSYFDETVRDYNEWTQVYDLGYDLYLSRNGNHRGATSTATQTAKQQNLAKYKYRYYLLFLGFIADFVHRIGMNYNK